MAVSGFPIFHLDHGRKCFAFVSVQRTHLHFCVGQDALRAVGTLGGGPGTWSGRCFEGETMRVEGHTVNKGHRVTGLAPGQRQRKNTGWGLTWREEERRQRDGKGCGGRWHGWGFGEERSRVLKRWNDWIMCLCPVQNGDPVPLVPPSHTHTPPHSHAPTRMGSNTRGLGLLSDLDSALRDLRGSPERQGQMGGDSVTGQSQNI